jgi:hypothetical protein
VRRIGRIIKGRKAVVLGKSGARAPEVVGWDQLKGRL